MAQAAPGGGMGGGGAIGVGLHLQDKPFVSGISNVIGALGGMTNALTLAGGAVAGLITKEAIEEVVRYEEELADLSKLLGRDAAAPIMESISNLTKTMPLARSQLAGIAEQAARFGIRGRENIMEFTEVIGQISVATDATASEAAEAMVKIAAITGEPVSRIRDMGNALNELSNTAATSFSELIKASGKLAPILSQMGLPTEDIFALAAATNEVNISVRRGATRLRSFFQQLQGTDVLDQFARLTGKSTDEMVEMAQSGEGVMKILFNMAEVMRGGGEDARAMNEAMRNAAAQGIGAMSQNLPGLIKHLATARDQIKGGNSVQEEYNRRVNTAAAKQQLLNNRIQESQRELGSELLPTYRDTLDVLVKIAGVLDNIGRTGGLEETMAPDELEKTRDSLDSIVKQQNQNPINRTVKDFENLVEQSSLLSGALRSMGLKTALDGITMLGDQLADMNQHGLEPARESIEGFARSLETRVPQALRGQFQEGVRVISENFEKLPESEKDLGLLFTALTNLQLALSRAGAEADETGTKLQGHFEMATGEVVRFKKEHAQLLNSYREETQEIGRTEEEILRLRIGYRNLSAEQRRAVDSAIAHRDAKEAEQRAIRRLVGTTNSYINTGLSLVDQVTGRIDTFTKWNRKLLEERMRIEEGEGAVERYKISQLDLNEAMKKRLKFMSKYNEILKENKSETEAVEKATSDWQKQIDKLTLQTRESQLRLLEQTVQDLSEAFTDFVEDVVTGSDNIGDAITKLFASIAEDLSQRIIQGMLMQLFMPLVQSITGGGGGSSGLSALGQALTGAKFGGEPGAGVPISRQHGGPLSANQLALVGEKGPELFVPGTDGTVVPNDQLQNMGGGGTVQVNIQHDVSVQALDSKDVGRVLDEQSKRMAQNTVKEIRRSQVLRQALSG